MILTPAFRAAIVLVCSLFSLTAVHAQGQLYAPVLPKASKSLLLDITGSGSRLVAVGEHGHILFSDDAGANWEQAH